MTGWFASLFISNLCYKPALGPSDVSPCPGLALVPCAGTMAVAAPRRAGGDQVCSESKGVKAFVLSKKSNLPLGVGNELLVALPSCELRTKAPLHCFGHGRHPRAQHHSSHCYKCFAEGQTVLSGSFAGAGPHPSAPSM